MNRFLRYAKTADRVLTTIESALVVTCLLVLVVLGFAQVVMRNLFEAGFMWGDIVSRQLVLWICFLGASMAASRGRNIRFDFFLRSFPDRLRAWAGVFSNAFAAAVSAALSIAALTFCRNEQGFGETLVFSIPSWIPVLIIPFGFGMMSLHFSICALESAVSAASPPSSTGASRTGERQPPGKA